MATATTDVRAWLREQGHDVKERGAIPADLHALYASAHTGGPPTVQGEIIDSSMGVTEADFPPADDEPDDAGTTLSSTAKTRERKPRTVKPAASAPGTRGIRERIFGGTGKPKAPKAKHARTSLSDFAEETWSDLAFLAAPIPPLARILDIQAPYAGVVFDAQVKGTVLDTLLQPVAQYSGMFRGLNGLAGPPVYVGLICATGSRVQPTDPATGLPAVNPDGSPLLVFDQRTQMLFQGLRYSLLQMTKITEVNADAIMERRVASEERMAAVEVMIATIFDFPMPGAASQASPGPTVPRSPSGPGDTNGFRYPPPPVMDETGMDPGRL
jgi:hypothetical protein